MLMYGAGMEPGCQLCELCPGTTGEPGDQHPLQAGVSTSHILQPPGAENKFVSASPGLQNILTHRSRLNNHQFDGKNVDHHLRGLIYTTHLQLISTSTDSP